MENEFRTLVAGNDNFNGVSLEEFSAIPEADVAIFFDTTTIPGTNFKGEVMALRKRFNQTGTGGDEFIEEVLFLKKLNGSLLTLAPGHGGAGGLRRFLKAKADSLELTGYVELLKDHNLELAFEGNSAAVASFYAFLTDLKNQGMVSPWRKATVRQISSYRIYFSFDIIQDRYSGDAFDRIEEDSYSGPSDRPLEQPMKQNKCVIM